MKICIDPGHGGSDPGAARNGIREKDITLALAKRLSAQLEKCGMDSILTRAGDDGVSLASRCQTANDNKADLFVSIHVNANSGTPATGIETWIYRGSAKGRGFATAVQNAVIEGVGVVNRGVKESGFYVLSGTHMPAILIETGFMNHEYDRASLTNSDYQDSLVSAMAQGICSYAGIAYVGEESTVSAILDVPVELIAPQVHEPIPGYGTDPAAFIYGISASSSEKDKVKALQIALTLDGSKVTVDGILGPKTDAALKNHVLKIGSRGHLVVFVQELLGADIDAEYGPKTAALVKAWQVGRERPLMALWGLRLTGDWRWIQSSFTKLKPHHLLR